ncbi:Auxin-responsive family protein [Prunus dulcis]|uniref:Auxin-responsive family protein n=1 Tax=Prunus dulcis TaxID=3755 RepID=A0A4Y1RNK1_PRUDU|nr:Auxin-responsive family protein [Prunus dulcis]
MMALMHRHHSCCSSYASGASCFVLEAKEDRRQESLLELEPSGIARNGLENFLPYHHHSDMLCCHNIGSLDMDAFDKEDGSCCK